MKPVVETPATQNYTFRLNGHGDSEWIVRVGEMQCGPKTSFGGWSSVIGQDGDIMPHESEKRMIAMKAEAP